MGWARLKRCPPHLVSVIIPTGGEAGQEESASLRRLEVACHAVVNRAAPYGGSLTLLLAMLLQFRLERFVEHEVPAKFRAGEHVDDGDFSIADGECFGRHFMRVVAAQLIARDDTILQRFRSPAGSRRAIWE